MRILYGVAGEGMGHATRSHAFLADLVGEHGRVPIAPPPGEASPPGPRDAR